MNDWGMLNSFGLQMANVLKSVRPMLSADVMSYSPFSKCMSLTNATKAICSPKSQSTVLTLSPWIFCVSVLLSSMFRATTSYMLYCCRMSSLFSGSSISALGQSNVTWS